MYSVYCLVCSMPCALHSVLYSVKCALFSVQSAAAERVTAQSFCNQLCKNLRKWSNFKLDDKDDDYIDNDDDVDNSDSVSGGDDSGGKI